MKVHDKAPRSLCVDYANNTVDSAKVERKLVTSNDSVTILPYHRLSYRGLR